MVIKLYTHCTAKCFWDSQTSSPQTVLLTGLLGKTGVVVVVVVVVVCVCVCVGGGVCGFKIKGCGGNACPPTLACVLPSVACSLHCLTKANPDGIFLILNANSVRNSLEANSKFRRKCISKFIRGHCTGSTAA